MKFIFLIAAFNAFFFTILLIQKKPRNYHDKILVLWLIYLGLFTGTYFLYSHELFTHFSLFSNSLLSLFMLHGPFLYFYVSALESGKKFILTESLIHLSPFLLFNLYLLYASFRPELAVRLNIEMIMPGKNPPFLYLFFLILTALSGPVYFILSLMLFRKLDQNISNYSSSTKMNPEWLRILIIIFGILWTALIIITVIHHVFGLFSMIFCTDGLFLCLSVFVILIGYFGLKQNIILSPDYELISGTKAGSRYSGSRLSEMDSARYKKQLEAYISEKKPYLEPELTLSQLSEMTGIPAHYLSQVINQNLGQSFFDFINSYRVEAFKERLSDPEYYKYTLLGIAFECGFNSKTAFNRVFRQVTGMTPSEFRKKSSGR